MKSNTSKYLTTYSDYLWPPADPEFPSITQVSAYFAGYASKHNLLQFFHFNSTVIELSRLGEDYKVIWTTGGETIEKVFKYVIVATGHFSKPNTSIPNHEAFAGEVIHAGHYREPSVFAGKKLVCVGRSYSSSDIAYEALRTATSVTQLYSSNYLVATRKCREIPFDFFLNFAFVVSTPIQLIQTPEASVRFAKQVVSLFGNPSQFLPEWELPESPPEFLKFVINSEEYLEAISSKRISVVKGRAKEFYSGGLVLEDGSQVEAEVIVMGTGYTCDFSYFSEEIKAIVQYDPRDTTNPVQLFRGILHPSLPGLVFAGSTPGPQVGKVELPLEIGIRYVLGKLSISEEELWQGVRDEEFIRRRSTGSDILYPFTDMLKECMRILGIRLDMEFIRNELEFAKGPVLPQMLWLERPGQVDLAKTAIAEIKARYPHHQFN